MEEEKTNIKKKYIKLRNKFLDAYSKLDFFSQEIEQIRNLDIEKMSDADIAELSKFTVQFFSEVIENNYMLSWKNIINKTYSESEKCGLFMILNSLSTKDPACVYETFADTCDILYKLNDKKTHNEALQTLEDFASTNTIEKVLNKYGSLLYSNFQNEIKETFKKGFKKNKDVNYESVLAFFNESNEQLEKDA